MLLSLIFPPEIAKCSRKLLVESRVGTAFAYRPRDSLLDQWQSLVSSTKPSERLRETAASNLAEVRPLTVALVRFDRALVGVERVFVFAPLEVPPTEVVQQHRSPRPGSARTLRELKASTSPSDHVAGQGGHVRGISSDEILPRPKRDDVRVLKQWQRSRKVASQPQQPAALKQHTREHRVLVSAERFRVV